MYTPAQTGQYYIYKFHELTESVNAIIGRGDIYYTDLRPVVGSEQGGIRPVLIVQNDVGNKRSPIVICAAITSEMSKAKLPTHVELDTKKCDMIKDSVILLEQLRTIDKQRLKGKIYHIDEELLRKVDTTLMVSLGLSIQSGIDERRRVCYSCNGYCANDEEKREFQGFMDDSHRSPSLAVLIAFLIVEAVFYGFGAAIQNVSVNDLEKEMLAGNKKARHLLRIINRPTRFTNSIQTVINVIGIAIGAYILGVWKQKFEHLFPVTGERIWFPVLSMAFSSIILLVLLTSFGIAIPKRCAAKSPGKWGYTLVSAVEAMSTVLLPFIAAVTNISYVVLRLVGIDMNAEDGNVTERDVMSMVNEGHEQGVLEASEAEMITNIFGFTDKDAGDIMTHRKNLVALDAETPPGEAVSFILKDGRNSRFPVYQKDIDDIIGLSHMKDTLICVENEGNREMVIGQVPGLLREAHFIPETGKLSSLFQEIQSQRIHMEIVVNEYGQTAGTVTTEDTLEEIVGSILDEYDVDEELVVQTADGYVINDMTPLEDVAETLQIGFSEEDYDSYDTMNGFLISKLDRIPQEDEDSEAEFEGYIFKIISVENKMIRSVKVTPVPKVETEEDQAEGKKDSSEEEE